MKNFSIRLCWVISTIVAAWTALGIASESAGGDPLVVWYDRTASDA